MSLFTYETFSPHLNSNFGLDIGEVTVDLTLTEATKQAVYGRADMAREPFSLIFRGPGAAVLPQRTYAFRHPALGDFDMFIVPVGRDAEGVTYQAVFS